jgi:Tol biopolymer transport system component
VVRDLETGVERELAGMRYVRRPRWSPDGRTLLARGTDGEGWEGSFEIDPETGEVVRYAVPGMERFAVWSADGTALIYGETDANRGVGRVLRRDRDSGRDEELFVTEPLSSIGLMIAASRDGARLALTMSHPATKSTALLVVSSEGGAARELLRVEDPEWLQVQDFSPDGRFLVFRRGGAHGEDVDVFQVSVETGETKHLLRNARDVTDHPEGRRIGFTSGAPTFELYVMKNATVSP